MIRISLLVKSLCARGRRQQQQQWRLPPMPGLCYWSWVISSSGGERFWRTGSNFFSTCSPGSKLLSLQTFSNSGKCTSDNNDDNNSRSCNHRYSTKDSERVSWVVFRESDLSLVCFLLVCLCSFLIDWIDWWVCVVVDLDSTVRRNIHGINQLLEGRHKIQGSQRKHPETKMWC